MHDSEESQEHPGDATSVSMLDVLLVLASRKWLILSAMFTVAALAVAIGFVGGRTYTATTSFASQASQLQSSPLAGLASQFGITLPTQGATESPEFYADLLESDGLLRDVVLSPYHVRRLGAAEDSVTGDLVKLWGVEADSGPVATEVATRVLRERVSVSVRRETGVVALSVTDEDPALAAQIARRMLDLLARFNLEARQSRASSERRFVEGRLDTARAELIAAESNLHEFLERNRDFSTSSLVRFQHDRLEREMVLRQQVVTTLTQSFEQARIEEVRNTPVITVVEPPAVPVLPDGRHTALRGMLGLILGGIVGLGLAFSAEAVARLRVADPNGFSALVRAVKPLLGRRHKSHQL